MFKILLMGNPNVGKSVVFSRLTGTDVIVSNYPGTTVDYTKGYTKIGGEDVEVIDVPGTFSLEPRDVAEEIALRILKGEKPDLIIDVIDATKLERGLYLAFEIMERFDCPLIIDLNMWDVAVDKGIEIDLKKLREILGIPVIPTVAISGEGIKELVDMIKKVMKTKEKKSMNEHLREILRRIKDEEDAIKDKNDKLKLTSEERWSYLDKLAAKVVTLKPRRLSLKDAIGDLTVRPLTGIPIALGVLFSVWMFFSTFAGFFTDGFMVPLFDEHYLPWIQNAFPKEPSWLYALLVGTPGADNCFEAFGVLTTGLFVPFGVVLWAIIPLYLSVALLEDIGYLPRLAVLVDNILHKIGLHGFAIVPTILSFGCNIPGVTAARILETEKERFMMMTILAIFIPCGAQLGIMEETIAKEYGNWLMFAIIGYLLLGYFVVGWILNKIIPGRSPEILIDIPPYQMPTLKNLIMKTWIRVKSFLVHAVPFVILGSLLVNILYIVGIENGNLTLVSFEESDKSIMGRLSIALEPILAGWFGVPKETILPLVTAFLRKDLAVAQLSAIPMSMYQLFTSVVLISIYFPCIATFAMLWKELGFKGLLKSIVILIISAFTFGGLLHGLWMLMGVT